MAHQWVSEGEVMAILRQRIESDAPEGILATLRRFDGKKLTIHVLKHLPSDLEGMTPGENGAWRILKSFTGVQLVNSTYIRTQGGRGYSFWITEDESDSTIDCDKIEKRNPSYFAGRRERNVKRMLALKDRDAVRRFAVAINEVIEARGVLQAKLELLGYWTEDDKLFSSDKYKWDELAALVEES